LAEAVAYLAASPRALKVQVDLKEEVLALEEALAFLRALEPLRANPNLRVVVSSLADWNLRLLKRLDPALAIGLDPAYYLDAPVGTWSRLPVRVNAYGYLDDHPLGFRRFMPVRAYLEDRLEALLRSVPPFEELYLRKEFLLQALGDGFDPVAFARSLWDSLLVDVWTLDPEEGGLEVYLRAVRALSRRSRVAWASWASSCLPSGLKVRPWAQSLSALRNALLERSARYSSSLAALRSGRARASSGSRAA
jgi:glycerophosphoryl diester phosphodiesterase